MEIAVEAQRRREVDRVERAELRRYPRAGSGQNRVADPDQLEPRKHLLPAPTSGLAERQKRSAYLCLAAQTPSRRAPRVATTAPRAAEWKRG